MIEVVPVDRADIVKAQLFEQRAAGHHAAARIPRRGDGAPRTRELLDDRLCPMSRSDRYGRDDSSRER